MRVLLTVEFYHPHVGGSERVVQRIAEGLARRGHRVTVATSWDPARPEGDINGVRVEQFRVRGNRALGMAGEVSRYQQWMLGERFDLVMNYAAQSWPTDATLPVLGCLRDYDALVYHTETGADVTFGRQYGPPEQVVIPNGADGREFAEGAAGFRERFGIGSRRLLLHVGNHHRVKGHADLVQLLRSLGGLDVVLALIGDDPGGWRSCWQACASAARGDPRLLLLRALPRSDVVAAFLEADVVVLTSRFEAAPLVLVEAMAAGVPFVSYRVGSAPVLPGGVVVSGVSDMAQAVRDLLADDARRRALGRAGREYQRRVLDWEALVDRYEALFRSLVARRQERAGP
jgi:glycosyltransferase involved in cell wall biosynthesis